MGSSQCCNRCNSSVSWEWTGGNHIEDECLSPSALAAAEQAGPVSGSRPVPWSYYQNVVTSSYSYAWWGGPSKDLQICKTCHESPCFSE